MDTNNDKQKIISQITKEILNLELYDLIIQVTMDKKMFIRKFENESYQIYSILDKKRIDGISFIDFDNCAEILRERHRLGKNEDLIVFKVEYKYPGIKIPIIEYQIFDKNGKKKLNIFYCKNVKILYYIPKEINNYEDYKYNPEHQYYKDKCLLIDFNFSSAILLYDRKQEYNNNNMSLCESLCTFKGYINNNIICECNVKQKFNSFLNDNSDKYNLLYRFDLGEKNEKNFWTIFCFLNLKIKFSLLFIEYCIFYIIIFVLIISGALLFRIKGQKLIHKKIKSFAKIILMIKAEKGEINKDDARNIYLEQENEEEINENNKGEKEKNILYYNKEFNKVKTNKILKKIKGKKKYLIKFNKAQNTKKISTQGLNDISQNASSINSKSLLAKGNSSKSLINKVTQKKAIKNESFITPDYDLDNLTFKEAKLYDKRTFCQYYMSLIRTKHIIFFIFKPKYEFHTKIIRYCFLLFLFPFYLAINTCYVDKITIHNIYISKGSFNLLFNIRNIIYATLILYVLQKILYYFISIENEILEIKNAEGKNFIEIINEKIGIITMKCILFFAISLILLLLCGFYLSCFTAIFTTTKIHLIIRTIISLSFSLIIPLVLYLLPTSIRFYSFKRKSKHSEDFYLISQFLRIL